MFRFLVDYLNISRLKKFKIPIFQKFSLSRQIRDFVSFMMTKTKIFLEINELRNAAAPPFPLRQSREFMKPNRTANTLKQGHENTTPLKIMQPLTSTPKRESDQPK
jgi:hypothetical protein